MKQLLKIFWPIVMVMAGVFLGASIFNHFNAWLGIFLIVFVVIYGIYKQLINIKNHFKT